MLKYCLRKWDENKNKPYNCGWRNEEEFTEVEFNEG